MLRFPRQRLIQQAACGLGPRGCIRLLYSPAIQPQQQLTVWVDFEAELVWVHEAQSIASGAYSSPRDAKACAELTALAKIVFNDPDAMTRI